MNQQPEDQDPAALEAEIARLQLEQRDCQRQAQGLMELEMAGQGPFAQHIFELKQRKQMLGTQIQHLRVRLNHLRLGWRPPD